MPHSHRNVLLVEDHRADADLAKEAAEALSQPRTLFVALDGVEAMAFLRKQGRFACAPRPDLVLLDLNMPRKDGWAVLAEIRADATLSTIPVIILTSSLSPSDVEEAYRAGANAYVVKPFGFRDFQKIMEAINAFWFDVALLPGDSG